MLFQLLLRDFKKIYVLLQLKASFFDLPRGDKFPTSSCRQDRKPNRFHLQSESSFPFFVFFYAKLVICMEKRSKLDQLILQKKLEIQQFPSQRCWHLLRVQKLTWKQILGPFLANLEQVLPVRNKK